jgi:hypothetical protein
VKQWVESWGWDFALGLNVRSGSGAHILSYLVSLGKDSGAFNYPVLVAAYLGSRTSSWYSVWIRAYCVSVEVGLEAQNR